MSLASKLKELRLKTGQSLQEVANAVGASKAHVWELEMGKSTNPSLDLMRRFAEHYKITVASLIGEAAADMPDRFFQMYKDFERLDPRDQAFFETIMAEMKKRRSTEGGDAT
jgi:transcriptional regulator with XRE-family HTH domain